MSKYAFERRRPPENLYHRLYTPWLSNFRTRLKQPSKVTFRAMPYAKMRESHKDSGFYYGLCRHRQLMKFCT